MAPFSFSCRPCHVVLLLVSLLAASLPVARGAACTSALFKAAETRQPRLLSPNISSLRSCRLLVQLTTAPRCRPANAQASPLMICSAICRVSLLPASPSAP
eukprot:1419238-Prymnesium_polylepis.2